ncbi:MAG TPA: hypothetical protein VFW28_06720 [Micropepsaceae bacterium]|nr:hypothetical protein [Micropepsaceae bacterium]
MPEFQTLRFTATLYLFRREEGGRATAFVMGGAKYRPQFRLNGSGPSSSCFIDAISGEQRMAPGERQTVEMSLLHPEYFHGQLGPGTKFEICEGPKVVGTGVIREIN